jgi:hypothetical protein
LRKARSGIYKGYSSHDTGWDGTFEQIRAEIRDTMRKRGVSKLSCEADFKTLIVFRILLNYCAANHIKVFLVFAPTYYEAAEFDPCRPKCQSIFKRLAYQYGATYLDYSNDSICYDKFYFMNSSHLNRRGAECFSLKLARTLRQYIDTANHL